MGKFLKHHLARGPLSHLSVTNDPYKVFDNHDRLEAFRECVRPTLINNYPWPHLRPKVAAKVISLRVAGGRQ